MKKIIKIESNNCPQCRLLDVMLGAAEIEVDEELNIDETPEVVDEYGIMGVPVLIFKDEDGNEVDRIVGVRGITPDIIKEKL
jgi:thiol-disulfide isomerase/thioredoxin